MEHLSELGKGGIFHFKMAKEKIRKEPGRSELLAGGQVVPDSSRCVQCGICTFNCPIGLDVRRFAWLGEAIREGRCLTCGECVRRCPRGVLQFEETDLFQKWSK